MHFSQCNVPCITYAQATKSDVVILVQFINTYSVKDKDRIIALPQQFIYGISEISSCLGCLFVVCYKDTQQIVAQKKLFIIESNDEFRDILTDEIGAKGEDSQPKNLSLFDLSNRQEEPMRVGAQIEEPNSVCGVAVYNGADFTYSECSIEIDYIWRHFDNHVQKYVHLEDNRAIADYGKVLLF